MPHLVADLTAMLDPARVLHSREHLLSYGYDGTAALSGVPAVVVMVKTVEEVAAVVKYAGANRIAIVGRGSGTGLSGGSVPSTGCIVLCTAQMDKVLELDEKNLTVLVESGCITQKVSDLADSVGLLYPPDPGSMKISTIGGNVAENSGGLRGLKYGITRDYVMGMEAVLMGGETIRLGGKLTKDVAGYDLVRLLVGSEGTLAVLTEITVKLLPMPAAKMTGAAFFVDLESSARSVGRIVADRILPATLEFLDRTTMQVVDASANLGLPDDAGAMLIFGQDGAAEVVERETRRMAEICREEGAIRVEVAATDAEADKLLAARRGAIPALARLAPTLILEDVTVPRSELPAVVRKIQQIGIEEELLIAVFGHAGDGNLHPVCCIDDRDPDQVARVHRAFDRIFATALEHGGTITGEHGIGVTKLSHLEDRLGATGIELLRGIKRAFDPLGLLNPGKAVP